MWIMLTDGALSVVQRTKVDENDDRTLQVRARRREWLDSFRAYCPELGEALFADGKADYSWRAFARPEDVARAMARVVLGISYSNFKNAAASEQYGLKDPQLRSGLVGAYHKVWDDILAAGDGHSVYDWKSSSKGGYWPTGIEACRRWGHFWPASTEKCKDCGEPNPAFPEEGPKDVFPPGYPKKSRSRKRKQPSAKPSSKQAPASPASLMLQGSDACPGSWTVPVEGSTELSVPDNGYQETGVCPLCGTRQKLTHGGNEVTLHWADVEASV